MYVTIACMPHDIFRHKKPKSTIKPGWVAHLSPRSQKNFGRRLSPIRMALVLLMLIGMFLACTIPMNDREITPHPQPSIPGVIPPAKITLTPSQRPDAGPVIRDIALNTADYPGELIPRYQKLEITFQVDTSAANLQLPYDASPPPGLQPGMGVSVDAHFTPDNWRTVYSLPAFYYQFFEDQTKSSREWFYPKDNYAWKVRFAPDQVGDWQVKLVAQDSSGLTESGALRFSVGPSDRKGFIRVAEKDPRYFEFENGKYFPALGYNMNYDHVSWNNPVLDNQADFQIMEQNGIQLVRIWLSQWGIFGPSWNPWNAIDPELHGQYIPYSGLTFNQSYPGSEVSLKLDSVKSPCMFIGWLKAPPAVLPNTPYRVRVRYRTENISGSRNSDAPYGLVAKTGGWLWGDGNNCQDTGSGEAVTPHQLQNSTTWQTLEGRLVTGNTNFLPNFYLALENVTQGQALIDYVWIEQELPGGQFGPNIVSKPWMSHHLYFEQRNSYAFDKLLELAEEHEIYLRLVVLEKNDWIFNRLDDLGQSIPYDPLCDDADPGNDPERCPGNRWFYGSGREITKVRWLQRAWWRYLQARWGYSIHIHSWELLNEGDPASQAHYLLADEFGKYMHQYKPNAHLVSTSNWHSFPVNPFWANPSFPDVDFADIHLYVDESAPGFRDTTFASTILSLQIGAKQPGGAGKPVIRGETGFTASGSEPASDQLLQDLQGIWLHNFLWAGINPGGLIESYWYEQDHIYRFRPNGELIFDHRHQFRSLSNFLQTIPLNTGSYQDASAVVINSKLRVMGQKDLFHQRAHLWVQNIDHTWVNVVGDQSIAPASGSVRMTGFLAGQPYRLEWWDTYEPDPTRQIFYTETITAASDGSLLIPIVNLISDLALQIYPQNTPPRSGFQLYIPTVMTYPGS